MTGRREPERNAYRDFLEWNESFLFDDICKCREHHYKENWGPRGSIAPGISLEYHQDGGQMVLATRDPNIPRNVVEAAPSTPVQDEESSWSAETGWEVDESAADPEMYRIMDSRGSWSA
jgi:hypothetical protein